MSDQPIPANAEAAGIAELVSRRKWTEAVDALRGLLLAGRAPSVQGRLQLADLMVSAGREKESLPILLGLADELVSARSLAKAVAVLKRVDRIQPGREDVQRRLAEVVRMQAELAPEHTPRRPGAPVPAKAGLEAEAASRAASAKAPARAEAVAEPEPTPGPARFASSPATSAKGQTQSDDHLRGVLREFLGLNVGDVTLPFGRLKAADVMAEMERAQAPVDALPEHDAQTRAAADVATRASARVEAEILDLVADVLRQPFHEETHQDGAQSEAARVTRLLAVPLFAGLSAAELLAVVHGLALRTFEPGDILVTEGEPGRSLFVLTSGRARVFVRSRDGHAVEVAGLDEGDFFGEIAALSGAPRGATVTAAEACEVLELDKSTLDAIALAHPRVRAMIEATYLERAGDASVAGVREAELGARQASARAVAVLEARFGEGQWDPHVRLELADALLRSGKHDEAVPILVGLADELAREGQIAKAIALVKKVERIQNRHVEELLLAPMPAALPADTGDDVIAQRGRAPGKADLFERWLLRLAREGLGSRAGAGGATDGTAAPAAYRPGLRASPLFQGLSEEELLSLVCQLRLIWRQAGDIIVSEGEPGEGLFVLAAGAVKVLVRDQNGHNVAVCRLEEGAFFGEIAALSGAPRSATVVAATPCELLELDRKALGDVTDRHPRVREALDQAFAERGSDPAAERIRRQQ
jgi:CRP-like cAMP-binding protein